MTPQKTTIGFTCSAFDLLHAGHILMLEEAKAVCDYLIVGLQTDPSVDRPEKKKPIQSVFERYVQLKGCRYVDEIVPYTTEDDLYALLLSLPIDIRILGEDWEGRDFTGGDLWAQGRYEVHFNRRKHTFSTTELRTRCHEAETQHQV
jgi:glycerol-3-phosphate cytidylyltransferase